MRRSILSAIFAVACGGATTTQTSGDAAIDMASTTQDGGVDLDQLCVDTINNYRHMVSLAAYARWSSEESCTATQAMGDGVAESAHAHFGACSESAQNECPSYPAPASTAVINCLALMWAEGPGSDFNAHGHYINMTSTSYTKVACGFATLPDGSLWIAMDFSP